MSNSHTTTSPITALLNATLASIHELASIETGKPSMASAPIMQTDYGVLIGIVGDVKGRIFILGESKVFAHAGLAMYGMELEGEMLESFVGEFGNSVAGHAATKLYDQAVKIDITPPTTMQGNVKLGGFSKAIQVPFLMTNGAQGQLVLAVEEK
jgi:chemotaxis protein CheX